MLSIDLLLVFNCSKIFSAVSGKNGCNKTKIVSIFNNILLSTLENLVVNLSFIVSMLLVIIGALFIL